MKKKTSAALIAALTLVAVSGILTAGFSLTAYTNKDYVLPGTTIGKSKVEVLARYLWHWEDEIFDAKARLSRAERDVRDFKQALTEADDPRSKNYFEKQLAANEALASELRTVIAGFTTQRSAVLGELTALKNTPSECIAAASSTNGKGDTALMNKIVEFEHSLRFQNNAIKGLKKGLGTLNGKAKTYERQISKATDSGKLKILEKGKARYTQLSADTLVVLQEHTEERDATAARIAALKNTFAEWNPCPAP